ncbi:cytochrome P450, partial [Nocardioides humilatus]
SFGQSSGLKDDLVVDDDVGQKKRLAFLDLLLESSQSGVAISDEEIKEQVDTIMFEGHDTTAAGSSFFLSMMGIHQDIQDKVIEELDQIFGDSDRPVTFQDTLEMKYLERCLMETLRLYPPVPIIARQVNQEITLPSNGKKIPQFSPDGRVFQVEYAAKAVENSGTVIGLRGKDGVVFAVEKLITSKLYE